MEITERQGCLTLQDTHYYGVLNRDASGVWQILNDAGHQSAGLIAVSVDSLHRLLLTYPPVLKVGTFTVTADETWCGKYHPGASVGLDHALINIRNSSGVQVYADTITGGNLFVDMWGLVEIP